MEKEKSTDLALWESESLKSIIKSATIAEKDYEQRLGLLIHPESRLKAES
ncbi:MAG: hypothetical protein ACFFDC_17980 [Promethearchaeota archaeon]